jgi:hypothetical protein
VSLRTLVEAVHDHLEPVVAELEDEMSLKEAGGGVGEAATAKTRVDREAAEARDAAARVAARERERSGALAVDLDDEAALRLRILVLSRELFGNRLPVEPLARGEERTHVVVREDVEQEVEVVRRRAPQRDVAHGSWIAGARRASRTAPEPSATPARISASPPSVAAVMLSSSRSAP